ncbi:hypothetical protein DNTS_033260 [Danionella cerebrum]|uniref:Clu domain-containing protein n=1 Tax=Danionella cerebrum TaxID=2873325 RepID=A0A553RL55_9TELE|nr:hypothetical protein DNTS_033260 [Danionella translucida]
MKGTARQRMKGREKDTMEFRRDKLFPVLGEFQTQCIEHINMGNILCCCRKVSELINSKAVWNQTEEHSALLSQEISEIETLSPDPLASPVLDQDHLLFPDIVLSSNLHVRGDTTELLEPKLPTKSQEHVARREDVFEGSNLQNEGERIKELLGLPSTNSAGTNHLHSKEDEWPLLSPLFQIPTTQTQICTHGPEHRTHHIDGSGTDGFSSLDASSLDMSHRVYGTRLKKTEENRDVKISNETCPNGAAEAQYDKTKMQPVSSEQKKQREAQTIKHRAHVEDDVQVSEGLEMVLIKDAYEKERSHVEKPDPTDVNSEVLGSQLEQALIWTLKEVELMQWDLEKLKESMGLPLRHREETSLTQTQVVEKEDQTERFTLFVVDKLFLVTPDFTAPSPDTISTGEVLGSGSSADEATEELLGVPDIDPSEDAGFTVKIEAPGAEATDFQVSPLARVQEIKQVLMDQEETCQRTCFSLQLNGVTLDCFTHLRSIPGLQDGSVLTVVEEAYTVREVRIHLSHVRELIKSLDLTDGYNGVEGSSPSFLSCITEETGEENTKFKRRKDGSKQMSWCPPDHLLPGCKERLLVPLQPRANYTKLSSECLKVLVMSSWNPPPGNRRMHGDLMYLSVVTMEDKHFSITASTQGFYINQSTPSIFNPKRAVPSVLSHNLLDLLGQISPIFKKNFTTLLKKRGSTHPFERIATPFQVFTWTAPALDHTLDCVRAEEISYEEQGPVEARDWNEELQTSKELPRKNITERLIRDRAVFKVNSDFVATATQGAMAVLDGNVVPINPSEEHHQQMFIWKNIFFSFGLDVQSKCDLGGKAAAHAVPALQLSGLKAYWSVDQEGLYLIGTAVIDYRGYRIVAQTVMPEMLERDQEQSVVYGSADCGNTIISDERDGTAVELRSSVEQKVIVGNDGRHYTINLLFTFPRDLNFLPLEGEQLNLVCQQLGFPRGHPHGLVCLRPELIQSFVEHRNASDIAFNPNIFSPGVRFPKECTEEIQRQKQLLKDTASFLISNQIPAFMKSCFEHVSMPVDGVTLTEALHQHGINIRYLGCVLQNIEKRVALCEVITRCAKHLFNSYLLAVEPLALSVSVTHFLNCFLSCLTDARVTWETDTFSSKSRSRRHTSQIFIADTGTSWTQLTPSALWSGIRAEALERYHYMLPCRSVEEAVDKCRLQRISLLREIALKTGIQILLRNYDFDCGDKPVFTEEDLLNIFPVVKHISPRASCLKEGCELISQALELFMNVYGALHQDVCVCLRLLGRIHYIFEDYSEALSHQQRAVLISERVLGVEHPSTIREYRHLGLYCFTSGQPVTALRLLYRARFLMLLVCGEDHPEMALLDSKIGLLLHSLMACDLSLKFLENALALTAKYHGPSSFKLAQSHHLVAKVHESKGDFRLALKHEKERYSIYRKQVGEAHEKTQESSEYLKHLTHQAVILQKTMNWIHKTGSDTNIASLNLKSPSRVWTVKQLNLVSGIVLFSLSNGDLEKLRTVSQSTSNNVSVNGGPAMPI